MTAPHGSEHGDGATPVALDHEVRGPADGDVVLLVSGLGAQRTWWPEDFVDALARARRVVLPDNRDSGRSPVLHHLGGEQAHVRARMAGRRDRQPPYTLSAMAADHVRLLDGLGVEQAHVVGASMGGVIAQHLAMDHPDRVRSLTAIMSTTGERAVSQPTEAAAATLVEEVPLDSVEAFVAASVASRRVTGTPEHLDVDALRERYRREYEAGIHPLGTVRQLLALIADGNRTSRLGDVTAPTLVVHGTADPLIPIAGGRALADAIDGARFVAVEGMGHDLPAGLLDRVLDPVLAHLDEVEARDGA